MLNIALVFPLCYEKHYYNPIFLQKIEAIMRVQSYSNNIMTQIIDYNERERNNLYGEKEEYDLAIIDTPEGGFQSVLSLVKEISANRFVLVGDTVRYGLIEDFVCSILHQSGKNVLFCRTEFELLSYVGAMLKETNADWMSDDYLVPSVKFSSSMYKQYEKFGIQIYLECLYRGCENNCSFCKLNGSQNSRGKPVKTELDIVPTLVELQNNCNKLPFVQFVDENFFGNNLERLHEIDLFLSRLRNISFNGCFGIDTRLDSIICKNDDIYSASLRKKLWTDFAALGLRYCFIGLETISSSQSVRYNKQLDCSNLFDCLAFLDSLNIKYTIGLILWDPMVQDVEVSDNISFIKNNQLLGKTASLLKPMRIQINSPYFKKYGNLFCNIASSSDYFNLDEDCVIYQNMKIRRIIPHIQYIYSVFNQSGYRHSDVALFEVVLPKDAPSILSEIPRMVSEMEYSIVSYLLNYRGDKPVSCAFDAIVNICKTCVSGILNELNDLNIYDLDIGAHSVAIQYIKVFHRIQDSLSV